MSAQQQNQTTVNYTPEQQRGIDLVTEAARTGTRGVIAFNGPAGSGKTTLVRAITDRLGDAVQLVSPTHKANRRLAAITGRDDVKTIASTTRRFLGAEDADDRGVLDAIATRRQRLFFGDGVKVSKAAVVICDEASMLSRRDFEQLQRYAANSLLVLIGDAFQLAPVGDAHFSVFHSGLETVHLSQVHRQAAESSVLVAANHLRIRYVDGECSTSDCLLSLPRVSMEDSMKLIVANWRNYRFITITHTNGARQQITRVLRHQLNFTKDDLHEREPLLIKKASKTASFHKGDILRFVRWAEAAREITLNVVIDQTRRKVTRKIQRAVLRDTDGKEHTTILLLHALTDSRDEHKEIAAIEKATDDTVTQAELAYVITAHSAQGSEWDEVLFFHDEMFMPGRENRFRFAYTAITRARKTCYLVKLNRCAITTTSFDPEPPEVKFEDLPDATKALFSNLHKKAA